MGIYDIAVVGAGAAGSMAAIRSAQNGKNVILLERNDIIGKKILITGKGRCNVTNMASMDDFMSKFGKKGEFLRTAFSVFFNEDLLEFFRKGGLEMKTERQNRVFPADDNAKSVVAVLKKYLQESGVELRYNTRVARASFKDGFFQLTPETGHPIQARRLVLSTGGASYKATGSSGDGFKMAAELGHNISALHPGLVPMKSKEPWVKDLQGLALKNIRLIFKAENKKISSDIGEMMFTHFGVSGPLILDLSSELVALIERLGQIEMYIDLKPGIGEEELDKRILSDIKMYGGKDVRNFLKTFMPSALVDVFARLAELGPGKRASQITAVERKSMKDLMKALPITLTGHLPLEEAMVTTGGVLLKEIDPRTMQSRLVPGLYFAGEIIELAASSGGYNLQQAFSTGFLAGEEASKGA